MFTLIGYLALIFTLLIFLVTISIYTLFLIYSSLMGSPYVPTKQKEVEIILAEAGLKKGGKFVELGCGDGRVVRTAVKKYRLKGLGFDINPILTWVARFKARWQHLDSRVVFQTKNIFAVDLTHADYVYLFLMPELIAKLAKKLEKELKKNTLVISHGFKIIGWEDKLYKALSRRPFGTYYYRFK